PVSIDSKMLAKSMMIASYSATLFCSFCYLKRTNIDILNVHDWPTRSAKEHIVAVRRWQQARTHTEREAIFRAEGVRYSCFIELPYWNPVAGPVLGLTHNICEGILANYFRKK
ncbi:hypothetical protein BT69DRAFT_1234049, partial [Atractiella rhizophila]